VKHAALVLLLVTAIAVPLGAQSDVAARLAGRVPPEVARAVAEIAAGVAARGLPVEPLVQKAVEGGAKGVPSDRVIAAVRALAARLDEAAGALRSAGLSNPDADLVDGTAYALSQGLSAAQVRDLARAIHAPYDAATTLRVAATLSGLGVPPKQTVQLVEGVLQSGGTPDDVLDLPSEVEAGMAHGASAAQAAQGLGHDDTHGRPPTWVPPGHAKKHKP